MKQGLGTSRRPSIQKGCAEIPLCSRLDQWFTRLEGVVKARPYCIYPPSWMRTRASGRGEMTCWSHSVGSRAGTHPRGW